MSKRRVKNSDLKSNLQEEQYKLVQMEKTLLGMLGLIDSAVNDLVMEEFQIKAKIGEGPERKDKSK